jgi:hypothetical protein
LNIKNTTIGREDKIDFLELDLFNVNVKIDTGAFTSVIHCSYIKEVEEQGKKHLEFKLFDESSPEIHENVHVANQYRKRTVKSSNGESENRFVIQTTVVIFKEMEVIEMSLTDRGKMTYPVLLGRRFISHKFIVDPAKVNLSFKHKNRIKI